MITPGPPAGRLRIAVDIGGTFTDCVVVDASGHRWNTKSLSTPGDPGRGVFDCLRLAADRFGLALTELVSRTEIFVHGTTVGTNALVERRGARTGLLMTRGHEETFLIGRVRQKVAGLSEREKSHLTHLHKADPPIVSPLHTRGVPERIDVTGAVVAPLDTDAAAAALDELVADGVDAVAIVLLWSFVNGDHERRLAELARQRHPGLYVAASVDVAPVLGEYERCVATVLNAYLGPLVGGYLGELESRLRALGMPGSLLVMQANGGLSSVDGVRSRPLLTVDSGPAGGVLGGRYHAAHGGLRNIVCADVGGTTFDVGLIHDGQVQQDQVPVIDKYEYALPKVYVKSIGAGGGSIAWLDGGASLRVGPQSAGADPGPACYGGGGTRPTVTDAHLVLGYLEPAHPLGGRVKLDVDAARAALGTVAGPLGIGVAEAAAAISAIANAQMADLIRRVTVERGLDPREFAIFAYGGAGPVFAAFLARQTGSKLAYVPRDCGVFSAFGMLTSDPLLQQQRTALLRMPLDDAGTQRLDRIYAELDEQVRTGFDAAGFAADQVAIRRSVDLRFTMQVHELEIDVPGGTVDGDVLDGVHAHFLDVYRRTYGGESALPGATVEMAKFRSSGSITMDKPSLAAATPDATDPPAPPRTRQAMFDPADGFVPTTVHSGQSMAPGTVLDGPAIVARAVDTVVIPPGARATVDDVGGMVIGWER